MTPLKDKAIIHNPYDNVSVVIQDVAAGARVGTVTLDGREAGTVEAAEDIPFGHKIAVRDLAAGEEAIEYGRPIGRAFRPIAKGSHVHTHNLKSIRWGEK